MPASPEKLIELTEPTPEGEVKQKPTFRKVNGRSQPTGKTLSYVDARYVMDRLDTVVGQDCWTDTYTVLPDGSVVCELSILVDHVNVEGEVTAEWVSKTDVGVPSSIESQKGAFSDALKRAAVKWGIARDLYEDREDERAPAQAAPRPLREQYSQQDEELFGDADPYAEAGDPRAVPVNGNGRTGRTPTSRPRVVTSPEEKNERDFKDYDRFIATWTEENSPWSCPDHGTVRVNEPWITQDGKAIGGSLKCTEPWSDCQQQGPWISTLLKGTRPAARA